MALFYILANLFNICQEDSWLLIIYFCIQLRLLLQYVILVKLYEKHSHLKQMFTWKWKEYFNGLFR